MGDQQLGHAPCLTLNRPTMRSSSVEPSSSSPVLPRNRLKVCSQSSKLSNSDSSSLGYTWTGQAVRPHASILPIRRLPPYIWTRSTPILPPEAINCGELYFSTPITVFNSSL